MKRLSLVLLVFAGVSALAFFAMGIRTSATPAAAPQSRAAVVVELFTSEGCSSCPPADAVLSDLVRTQPVPGAQVIALGQHVDYWNRLGWTDPYSSHAFSVRQNEYANFFHSSEVYTPQMIVDGRTQFVGSDRAAALQAIARAARAPKAHVEITKAAPVGDKIALGVRVDALPPLSRGDRALVFLAVTEDDLHSDVRAGENAGRSLNHTGVVRQMRLLGTAQMEGTATASPTVSLAPDWNRTHLHAVVFVQEQNSRRMLGAAILPLG
jgi:hypothetical protein